MRPLMTTLALLLCPLLAFASVPSQDAQESDTTAQTYELTTIAVVRSAPDGQIVDVWDSGTRFTSTVADDNWVRVSGYFPGDSWQPSDKPLWISRHYVDNFTPKYRPPRSKRPPGVTRYIEIDKSTFALKVVETREDADAKAVIFETTVALGMDRCLPQEKGGRCYYTEPGEYHVRWKVHDPEGIEWCIPKSMEKEYAGAIARGERCYRGAIGKHALNIGKTYAIHGTSNPSSLGKRVSHGCIRTANSAAEKLFSLMDEGDKVYIIE